MNDMPKTLYHGSQFKISDGIIHKRPAHINGMKTPITAVFATPSFTHAKLYAMMRLISSGWKSPQSVDTLYVEQLNQNIPKKAYVYEVDSDGFLSDGSDYYCLTDKKTKKVYEIDIMQEIKNGNIKVYVLKNKLASQPSLEEWRKICKHKDNFELYKPDSQNIDTAILAQKFSSKVIGK